MITEVKIKYFHEKTDKDFELYNKLYDENIERIIFLQTNLSHAQQINSIQNYLNDNRDILTIRFPLMEHIQKNKIIKNVILGNGVACKNNKVWYPKELWIYSPMKRS